MNIPERSVEDERRLLRLRVIAKAMLATAFLAVVFVFLSAFLSGDKPGDPTPGMRVAVGDLAPGATRTLIWEGRPIIVQRRTPVTIELLRAEDGARDAGLQDPLSRKSEQPEEAVGPLRSVDPDWFVAIALGTDYGCPIRLVEPASGGANGEASGGAPATSGPVAVFTDDCRGSRYDAAGRVFEGDYADRNLVVPAHRFDGEALILGGG